VLTVYVIIIIIIIIIIKDIEFVH